MTNWELAEKPRRKGRQFAALIQKMGDVYVIKLSYYPKPPYGSMGYLDKDVTHTPKQAKEVANMMLKDLKKGKFDRFIDEDLKAEKAYAKFR